MAASAEGGQRVLGPAQPVAAVEQYLEAMNAQQWERLAETISPARLHRNGPFADLIDGKDAYVSFLSGIISTLPNYELRVDRIAPSGSNRFYVELSELFDVEGERSEVPEVCVFETGDDGLICFVSVFLKQPGATGPVEGASAAS